MKKIILGLIISTIAVMAEAEIVNIKKALYSEYSYEVTTILTVISKNNKITKDVSANIKYKNNKLIKTKSGFHAESSAILKLRAQNNIITEVKTKTIYSLDKKYNIISLKEKTLLKGKEKVVSCSAIGKKVNLSSFNQEIGFKSSVSFNCSDKILRKKEIELKKSHLGKIMLEVRDIMSGKDINNVDTKRILLTNSGNIEGIAEELKSKIFELNYMTTDIK